MKLIPGRRAQSLDDAIKLAFGEAGRQDMSPMVVGSRAGEATVRKANTDGVKKIKKGNRALRPIPLEMGTEKGKVIPTSSGHLCLQLC